MTQETKETKGLAALNNLVELDVKQMLDLAKRATGRSQKFLVEHAIRSKYGRYLEPKKAA